MLPLLNQQIHAQLFGSYRGLISLLEIALAMFTGKKHFPKMIFII